MGVVCSTNFNLGDAMTIVAGKRSKELCIHAAPAVSFGLTSYIEIRMRPVPCSHRKNNLNLTDTAVPRIRLYSRLSNSLLNIMASVPRKVVERLTNGVKRFQPILVAAKTRDVGETDTVTIVKDMLADIFGYDKYSELTSEFAIRGTYCDLAIKLDGKLSTLIEVKAIGIDLKEAHVKQAVDYAANQGVDWVLLTNGTRWCVYHVFFTRPIGQELVVDIDFSNLNHKSEADLETLFLWCKEGWQKSALGDFHTQKQALSRFFLGAMVLSDTVLEVVRRELRRVSPDVKIDVEQIRNVLVNEVLKREVMEGEKAEEAKKKIARSAGKSLRTSTQKDSDAHPAEAQTTSAPGTNDSTTPQQ